MEKYDVLVQGVVSTDVIFSSIPKMPSPGEEVYCGAFEFTCGAAYTTAVAFARLGLKVAIISPIGNDVLSQFVLTSLESEGVSTKLMKKLNQPLRTLSVAINYGGDRSFLSYQDDTKDFNLEEYTNSIIENVDASILHLGAGPKSLSSIQLAKEKGMKVSVDIGWDEKWLKDPKLIEMIQHSDFFTPNLKEALYMTSNTSAEDALHTLQKWCEDTLIIIKIGPKGALVGIQGEDVVVPGFKKNPIDTTGAGDVFAAGVLTGLLKGYEIEEAVRLGNFCGACSVEGLGGATKSPYWTQVEAEFLNTNKQNETEELV
ncbi:carbohydrate kinase family protein [Bacillus sp. sid0103]|uniref:carbohydrate kinase family protein n=1 Tax=Bacillus sp. sid0103 TaxID=2856337 RepID=UPI001C48E5C8|nr:carbohydrate kinase family protein [Bacillus sp. sid0103]MBV7504289.1 carbohydrate kinase family protein [Bacillus sp. sid0103]